MIDQRGGRTGAAQVIRRAGMIGADETRAAMGKRQFGFRIDARNAGYIPATMPIVLFCDHNINANIALLPNLSAAADMCRHSLMDSTCRRSLIRWRYYKWAEASVSRSAVAGLFGSRISYLRLLSIYANTGRIDQPYHPLCLCFARFCWQLIFHQAVGRPA